MTKKDTEETKGEAAALAGPVSAVPAAPVTPTASTSSPPCDVPLQYLCPITKYPMEDPAVASDGYTYER